MSSQHNTRSQKKTATKLAVSTAKSKRKPAVVSAPARPKRGRPFAKHLEKKRKLTNVVDELRKSASNKQETAASESDAAAKLQKSEDSDGASDVSSNHDDELPCEEGEDEQELEPITCLSKWWILRSESPPLAMATTTKKIKPSEKVLKYELKIELKAEQRLLLVDGLPHDRILSLGRQKPKKWEARPKYLLTTLQYGDGTTRKALLKYGDNPGFLPKSSDPPFKQLSLGKTSDDLEKFISICNDCLPEVQKPEEMTAEDLHSDVPSTSTLLVKKRKWKKRIRIAKRPKGLVLDPKYEPKTVIKSRKPDKASEFANGEMMSDFEDELEELNHHKVLTDIQEAEKKFNAAKVIKDAIEAAKSAGEPTVDSKLQREIDEAKENEEFQNRMSLHEAGQVTVFCGRVQTIHDAPDDMTIFDFIPRALLIDRPLDMRHVRELMDCAKNYRHLMMTRPMLLGFFHGTRKKFIDDSAQLTNKIAKAKAKDRTSVSTATPQTLADLKLVLVTGGTHTAKAHDLLLIEDYGGDAAAMQKALGLGNMRFVVQVYATSTLDDDKNEIHLSQDDIIRMTRHHNRPGPKKEKSWWDFVMSIRIMMLDALLMADLPLTTDITPGWTRYNTQCICNVFLRTHFSAPVPENERKKYDKVKDLIELSGKAFGDLLWINDTVAELIAEYFMVKPTVDVNGYSVTSIPPIINRTSVATPLTGLSPSAREKIVQMFRKLIEKLIETVQTRGFGCQSEITAIHKAIARKATKHKKRQIFLYGFALRAKIKDWETLREKYPEACKPENFDYLLEVLESLVIKTPNAKSLPKQFVIYYDHQIKKKGNGRKAEVHPEVKNDDEATSTKTPLIQNGFVLREAMFGGVILLEELDISTAVSFRPKTFPPCIGISAAVFFELSKLKRGPTMVEKIHTSMASNSNQYHIICLNDDKQSLQGYINKYSYTATTLSVQSEEIYRGETDAFGFFIADPISFVTILSFSKDEPVAAAIPSHKKGARTSNLSRHLTGFSGVLDVNLIKELMERMVETNGWVLDCASYDSDDLLTVAKATQLAKQTMHLFIWVDPSNPLSEVSLESLLRDVQEFTNVEAQHIVVDPELSAEYQRRKKAQPIESSHHGTQSSSTIGIQPPSASNFRAQPTSIDSTDNSTTATEGDSSRDDIDIIDDAIEDIGSPAGSVIFTGSRQLEIPPFTPVSGEWQDSTAHLLELRVIRKLSYTGMGTPIRASVPIGFVDVNRDGNCLFSSISVVVSGGPSEHNIIREKMCIFLNENKSNQEYIERILDGEPIEQYVIRMSTPCKSASDTERWGSSIDIQIISDLTQTDIWTYMADKATPGWEHFKCGNKKVDTTPYEAIYLQNSGAHYNVVTAVKSSQIPLGDASFGGGSRHTSESPDQSSQHHSSLVETNISMANEPALGETSGLSLANESGRTRETESSQVPLGDASFGGGSRHTSESPDQSSQHHSSLVETNISMANEPALGETSGLSLANESGRTRETESSQVPLDDASFGGGSQRTSEFADQSSQHHSSLDETNISMASEPALDETSGLSLANESGRTRETDESTLTTPGQIERCNAVRDVLIAERREAEKRKTEAVMAGYLLDAANSAEKKASFPETPQTETDKSVSDLWDGDIANDSLSSIAPSIESPPVKRFKENEDSPHYEETVNVPESVNDQSDMIESVELKMKSSQSRHGSEESKPKADQTEEEIIEKPETYDSSQSKHDSEEKPNIVGLMGEVSEKLDTDSPDRQDHVVLPQDPDKTPELLTTKEPCSTNATGSGVILGDSCPWVLVNGRVVLKTEVMPILERTESEVQFAQMIKENEQSDDTQS